MRKPEMNLLENNLYYEDITKVANTKLAWVLLKNKSILISGASGLVGSFLVDVLMEKNSKGLNCHIIALCRNGQKAKERFSWWTRDSRLQIISHDIDKPLDEGLIDKVDYVLHLASNTHPLQYATDPIGTITTNVLGTYNMLNYAVSHHAERFLLASSNEIYGENRGDVEKFNESYCGYIDCNTLRAGYPESKRCSEALCQAFLKQKNMDVVIARLTRCYGPTLLKTDTKALSQFLHKAVEGENIVLKSAGMQYYSYIYVADQVSALLTILLQGKTGEAYNVSDDLSDIRLRDLAELVAENVNQKVIYELPETIESIGYSKATKARLENEKLRNLGWKAEYSIRSGIERTISIMKETAIE